MDEREKLASKTVLITEKPSVAREFIKALQIHGDKKNGYFEGYSPVLNRNMCVTWAVGHLVTLSYPKKYDERLKRWSLDTLPFIPDKYLYEVISDVKAQFNVIKKLYNEDSTEMIYYVPDAAREGILIQDYIREFAGTKKGIVEKVVWIDSFTENEINRGIREAKPYSAYADKIKAARMRAIEDYLIGINFSRALSIVFGKYFNNKIASAKYTPISVGRVMSCVLGMVVRREREIRNFTPTPFYKIEADVGFKAEWKAIEGSPYYNSPHLYNESGFKERATAELVFNTLRLTEWLTVESVETVTEKKYAPFLFNLAEAQLFFSNKYKMSPDETLAIIQSLYEKKLVTYPRTDARVLSSAVAGEIKSNLKGLMGVGYKSDIIKKILDDGRDKRLITSKYVDDDKISDHYAIIPTGNADTKGLTEEELKVFHDIIERFLCVFLPPAEFTKTTVQLKHIMGENFFASNKFLSKEGFYEVLDEKPKSEGEKFKIPSEGETFKATFEIKEGKTTPPKRYTSGSMVIAMENAGKLIEDEALREQIKGSGIGTSATRAEIIKKLCKIGYLKLEKKTQVLTPLLAGEVVFDILSDTIEDVLSPEMTAEWERGLEYIENKEISYEEYLEELTKFIVSVITQLKDLTVDPGERSSSEEEQMVCPVCKKGRVRSVKSGYGCNRYKEGCKFYINEMIAGKKITAGIVQSLCQKGETGKLKGFKNKKGTDFSAKLVLKNGKIEFEF